MATIRASQMGSLRRAAGLSQRALANAAGTSRQAVGAIESGRMQPSVGIALELARALGASVEDVFGNREAQAPSPRRVAKGTVAGHVITHRLDTEAHLAIEPAETPGETAFIAGCDLAAGLLSRHATLRSRELRAVWLPMTNRAALSALTNGRVHAALVHAELTASSTSNRGNETTDFVAFELAMTEEGWLVSRGNPLGFRSAADLARGRIRVVNRPPGAGARRLLVEQLRRASVDPRAVAGYARSVPGQLDAGHAVAHGFADAAIGMASVARVCTLDFLPLRGERCSLVLPRSELRAPATRAILGALRSAAFRRDLEAMQTYDVAKTGEQVQ